MRQSIPARAVRLRLTLVGPLPEIWREVVVDADLRLSDLRSVIQAVFEGQSCGRHLFTDTLDAASWSTSRHRWGDRWTMIDFRDPTVVDAATVRVAALFGGGLLSAGVPLYYAHTCESDWLVEIEEVESEEVESDLAVPSSPRVVAGERRAPFPCARGAYEHAVLAGVLADDAHPEHETLRSQVERTVGPWVGFDPETFELAAAQRSLDALDLDAAEVNGRTRRRARPSRSARLSWIASELPRPARAGFEQHIAAHGLDLPTVITADEARTAAREFGWVLAHAAGRGIPVVDGSADSAVIRAGAEELGCDEARMLRVVAYVKRWRLVYSRNGVLRVSKRIAAAARPSNLWSLLARELVGRVASAASGQLFLLAVVDGSLADPTIGLRRTVETLNTLRGGHRYATWGYGREAADVCEHACDCPSGEFGTWHDTVTRAIRDAAIRAAGDEGLPVADRFHEYSARELGFAPEWLDEPTGRTHALALRAAGGTPSDDVSSSDETALLRELDELIGLLSLFGLERDDDGSWIVPSTLRELAKESLRGTG